MANVVQLSETYTARLSSDLAHAHISLLSAGAEVTFNEHDADKAEGTVEITKGDRRVTVADRFLVMSDRDKRDMQRDRQRAREAIESQVGSSPGTLQEVHA
jgi:hypothetical protein